MAPTRNTVSPCLSDSDDDLPSLDTLLAKPRSALSSKTVIKTSQWKNQGSYQSPQKRQIPQTSIDRSISASLQHINLTHPTLLPPESSSERSTKRISTRSPSKTFQYDISASKQPLGNDKRERILKSPVRDRGLLFRPLENTRAKVKTASSDQQHGASRKLLSSLILSSDDEDENAGDNSQEVDIFKGTGIVRKTPKSIVKKRTASAKEHTTELELQHRPRKNVNSQKIIAKGSTPLGPLGSERDDSLSDKLLSLTLDEPAPETAVRNATPTRAQKSGNARRPHRPHSSKSESSPPLDAGSILRFSPSPSPSRTLARPLTPIEAPPSPGKLKSPSKSVSPKKLQSTTLYASRPSLDAFWAQDLVNDFNDVHSPTKSLTSPWKKHLEDFFAEDSAQEDNDDSFLPNRPTSPRKKAGRDCEKSSETAAKKAESERLKAFDARKDTLAHDFLTQLDRRITNGQLASLTASAGGVQIVWSKKLKSTAGRANWRRERRMPSASTSSHCNPSTSTSHPYTNVATIELASKVVTSPHRLHNVLAHEFCHLANFMISHELKNPHGPSFKTWAKKVTAAFGDSHDIEVTTKHEYDISYKYVWVCERDWCQAEYKRHSKSIDVARHTCGKCRGKLVQVLPKPRASPAKKVVEGTDKENAGGASGYARFVKEQFGSVKAEMPPGSPSKEVMKEVAALYRARKREKEGAEVEVVEVGDAAVSAGEEKSTFEQDVEGVARQLDFCQI